MTAFIFGGAPGSGELVVLFLAVLVLFGAKRLPGIARNMGKALEEFRRAARDVSDEIMRADTTAARRSEPRRLPRQDAPDQPASPERDDGAEPNDADHDDEPDRAS